MALTKVTTNVIKDNAITSTQLASSAVTRAKLGFTGTVLNATMWTVPYSTGAATAGYTLLSNFTTSNTASLYSNTYTPVSNSSYIYYFALLDVDRNGSTNAESLIMFINGTPNSLSYHYPRNSGHEPHPMPISGSYTNSSLSPITFNLRGANGGGWTMAIGMAYGGTDQTMASNIHIFEVAR